MSSPFNHMVTWTWYILGLTTISFSLGWTAEPGLAQTALLSSSYAMGSGTIASNICAGRRFARGETESFAVCDAVGAAVVVGVEATVLHWKLTDEDWESARKIPGMVVGSMTSAVNVMEDAVKSVPRAVRVTA